jgi:hypothetical protein
MSRISVRKAFCVVSFLKGPNTIYSVGLVLGYQYILQGQKKSMTTQKALRKEKGFFQFEGDQ